MVLAAPMTGCEPEYISSCEYGDPRGSDHHSLDGYVPELDNRERIPVRNPSHTVSEGMQGEVPLVCITVAAHESAGSDASLNPEWLSR